LHEGYEPYHPSARGCAALDWGPATGGGITVHDDAKRRETHAGEPGHLPVSRRRFLELGAAWAVGLAALVAAGCGGEEDDDEGGEEDD
jgi:hypothetical protein